MRAIGNVTAKLIWISVFLALHKNLTKCAF